MASSVMSMAGGAAKLANTRRAPGSSGLPVKDGPTEAMLRSSHLGTREKYEAAIAAIPEGIFERLLSAFIARAGEKDLLDEVLDHGALTLRRSKFTQFFPDEDIIEVAAK